jgi:hypothetical protein
MGPSFLLPSVIVKIVLRAVKKTDGDADTAADGYTRCSDSNNASGGSQSRVSTKEAKTTESTKETVADDVKSTAPSMTLALLDGISEV